MAEKSVIALISQAEERPFNPPTARTAGSCERTGATKAPVLSPAIFSTGRVTLDLGWKRAPAAVADFRTRARQGLQTCFGGHGCLSAPTRPTQRIARANRGGIVGGSMTEKKWLHGFFVNAIAIPVTGKALVLLSVLRPSGRKSGPGLPPGTVAGV